MFELKFEDFTESKYIVTGKFREGLALVKNYNNLYGYIDKKGKEVIPCQFTKAFDFSEGLAAVSNEENLFGFIDVNGDLQIPFQYNDASEFSEGLVLVQESNYYKFINKDGEPAFKCIFDEATDFSEGFAVVRFFRDSKNKNVHMDKTGQPFGNHMWLSSFNKGRALIVDTDEVFQINRDYKKINILDKDLRSKINQLYSEKCGFILFSDKNGLYGFLDENLNLKIPSMFNEARSFQDDIAIIKLGDLIGFVTKEGKHIMFSSKNQYQEIKDFSEGLAAVKNTLGLWGFINKEGKEVIACQYKDVDPFSEGLCGVIDKDGRYSYINKNGTIKINLPIIYKSVLDTSDKTICIIGKTEKELCEKKLKVLSQVKEELLKQITSEVDAISTEVVGDLYQLTKTRKKSNSKNSKK